MARVKTGNVRRKRRNRMLKHSKGYRGGAKQPQAYRYGSGREGVEPRLRASARTQTRFQKTLDCEN